MKRPTLMDPTPESLGRCDRQPLVGRRFGMLTVTAEAGAVNLKRMVRATCDCGAERTVRANSLLTGNTTSCGAASCRQKRLVHGYAVKGSPQYDTYRAWTNMRARAAGHISGENYAGRGITVCERWLSFENFLADMGERPSPLHSLDRMNNDGPYAPENCRWATRAEQARNRRNVTLYTLDGETLCAADWAARYGVHQHTLRNRLRSGKTISQALGVNA